MEKNTVNEMGTKRSIAASKMTVFNVKSNTSVTIMQT